MQAEYNVETQLEPLGFSVARWVSGGWSALEKVGKIYNCATVKDRVCITCTHCLCQLLLEMIWVPYIVDCTCYQGSEFCERWAACACIESCLSSARVCSVLAC